MALGPGILAAAQGFAGGREIREQRDARAANRNGPPGLPGMDRPPDAAGQPFFADGPQREIVQGLYESADALGMDPEDMLTIASYETAGTFDPRQKGPTTQHGQHQGLIQWGEPQARQYGVDWNDPVRSQVGRDGAIVRYYRDRGWQPGMGMLDAYSIVNAGSPGRYDASDENNGGAPGTVRDKVKGQMAGHREKARTLLAQYVRSGDAPPARSAQGPGIAGGQWNWFKENA